MKLFPDVWAEAVFEASGRVSRLRSLSGLPESSGSAVRRLQGRTADSQGQSLTHWVINRWHFKGDIFCFSVHTAPEL